jgi:predicted DNA-binding transcriptional regulator AlpA
MHLNNRCNLLIFNNLAERVGFSNAFYYRLCAFNEMPKTEVLPAVTFYHICNISHTRNVD